jgi:hypothetical protein
LTRRFDLTGLQRATLIFRLWYDLEENFDYAYVEASRDGKTWDILQGRHSTTDNPVDQSFGPAYTGRSGSTRSAEWVTESIDLSAYAGGPVWVRFELVTDQAVHNPGLALDDIAIPEARFADDAESPGTWEAQGFLRTDNVLPQQFAVQFIPGGEGPAIQRMALDSNNSGQIALPAGKGGVLVINAFAPATSAPAPYILGLQLLP